ncbi:hypothetical protein AYI69_g4687, partial [Smittium culicis]
MFMLFLLANEIAVWPAASVKQYLLIHLEHPVTQMDFCVLIGSFIRSAIHVFDAGHFLKARSRDALVRRKTDVIPSSSRTRSMAAFFLTLATSRVAWSTIAWIGCTR